MPRPLVLPVLAAMALAGCVPAARYEEACSTILVEQEAHRRTQARLVELSRRVDELHRTLADREKRLERAEADRDEARLGADVAGAERRFAVELVEQLRAELARAGDHLRGMSDERSKLAQALEAAEARARRLAECEADAEDNAAVVRDLALALHEAVQAGDVELTVVEGKPVLRVPSSELTGEVVQETGRKVIGAVAGVAQRHGASRVRIRETGAATTAEDSARRMRVVSDLLVKAGLGSARVELAPAAAAGKGAPQLEIWVYAAQDPEQD